MKLTWIVPHFPPHVGGGEKLYCDVCSELVKRGFDIRVVTSASGGLKGHYRIKGMDVYYCDWPMLFGHPIVRFKDIIRHIKWCDIVHTAIYSTAIKTNLAAALLGKKCVTTIHEVMGDKWFFFEKNRLKAMAFRIYEKLIISLCSYVHVISEATAADFKKYGGRCRRLFKIYCFLDLSPKSLIEKADIEFKELFSVKPEEKGILYFGRPAKNKGIFVLLKAIRLFASKADINGRAVFCMILADEPADCRKKVLEYIDQNNMSSFVRVIPSLPRAELLKAVSGCDLCVIPSVTEGFGYSAAEACALKVPVIASDGGSLKEVVSGNCLFFRNRDSAGLAKALYDFIENGTAHFMSVKEKRFERDRAIDEYVGMYGSI